MDGKTFVGLCDQLLIEAVLAYSRLVTSDQQNCLSPRSESKSHSPDPARCIKSKLLHVGMLRSLQRVPIGASEAKAPTLQESWRPPRQTLHSRHDFPLRRSCRRRP